MLSSPNSISSFQVPYNAFSTRTTTVAIQKGDTIQPLISSPLTKALGSHNLYPLTFLWAPSQLSPSLAFCFGTKLTEVEVPFPKLTSSESAISLGRISLWTPTYSTFHPRHRNHSLGEWCWSTLFGLLSKSFASSSQYCRWWVLERGNSCYAMCEKWCRSC